MVILLPELLAGQGSAVWAVAGSQLLLQVWNQLILHVVLFFTYLWNREGSQISNCLFSHPLDYLQEGSKTAKGLQLLLKRKFTWSAFSDLQRCSTGLQVAYLPCEYVVEWAHDVVWWTESHVLIQGVRPFHGRGVSIPLLEVAEKELGKNRSLPCLRITSKQLP